MTDAGDNWAFITPTPGSTNNTTPVDDDKLLPLEFSLSAYPNPFNPSTTIRFSTPPASSPLTNGRNEVGFVTLKIYDILGNEVVTLVNEEKTSGTYNVSWNGLNNSGNAVSTGVYFARLSVNNQFKNLKLLLLK